MPSATPDQELTPTALDQETADSSRPSDDYPESSVRLYLSGLAKQTTKATIEAYFAEHKPKDIAIKDRGDGTTGCEFAFISVDSAAATTIIEMSPHNIDGTPCHVERTRFALRSKLGDKRKACDDSQLS